ncbi:MAG: S8 family serine peptidase [Halanaerobiales bacterium]
MKKTIILILLAIMVLILSSCETVPLEYGAVEGIVRDNDNNRISGASVQVYGENISTDDDGYYYVDRVVANRDHTIKVEKDGYIGTEDTVYIKPDQVTRKDLSMLRITEGDMGSISGKITISSGLQSTYNNSTNEISSIDKNLISSVQPDLPQTSNLPRYVEGEVLVKFHSNMTTQSIEEDMVGKVASVSRQGVYTVTTAGASTMTTEELYNYYSQRSDVEAVSYNHIGQLASLPNDELLPLQWNIHSSNLPLAWDTETGSNSVTVAVIDTGYVPHPDLDGNINTNLDYDVVGDDIDDPDDYDYNAIDEDSYYTSDSDSLESHGTHVAGIIGAVGNNNLGVAGVNWDVNIMPIRIFKYDGEHQWFEEEDLIEAIYYAIENGADIINLSLAMIDSSGPNEHGPLELALEDAYNQGVTVVAAAGNEGIGTVFYPASSQYTIAVGATSIENKLASYSNYGSALDILAPGGDYYDINNDGHIDGIISPHNYFNHRTNNYMFMNGTSMAAPMVSGVAALLHAQGITDPDEIRDILTNTASPVDETLDAGLLNAYAALNYNDGSPDPYSQVRIMAARREDNTYYVMSTISGADSTGDYNLKYVQNNIDLEVIGWIDENEDDTVNEGDYFGIYPDINNPVTINLAENEHLNNIDFDVVYQSGNTHSSYNNIQVEFGPPPSNNEKGE